VKKRLQSIGVREAEGTSSGMAAALDEEVIKLEQSVYPSRLGEDDEVVQPLNFLLGVTSEVGPTKTRENITMPAADMHDKRGKRDKLLGKLLQTSQNIAKELQSTAERPTPDEIKHFVLRTGGKQVGTRFPLCFQKIPDSPAGLPGAGVEFIEDGLARKLLEGKTQFTQDEWDALGVGDRTIQTLRKDDSFIKAGDSYFTPDAAWTAESSTTEGSWCDMTHSACHTFMDLLACVCDMTPL